MASSATASRANGNAALQKAHGPASVEGDPPSYEALSDQMIAASQAALGDLATAGELDFSRLDVEMGGDDVDLSLQLAREAEERVIEDLSAEEVSLRYRTVRDRLLRCPELQERKTLFIRAAILGNDLHERLSATKFDAFSYDVHKAAHIQFEKVVRDLDQEDVYKQLNLLQLDLMEGERSDDPVYGRSLGRDIKTLEVLLGLANTHE